MCLSWRLVTCTQSQKDGSQFLSSQEVAASKFAGLLLKVQQGH